VRLIMVARALVVGIERYANPRNNLIGVSNDVAAAIRVLGRFGINDIEVLRDQNATRKGIEGGLAALLNRTGDGDVAIFYYSGHGALLPPDFSGSDDPDGRDEALVPYESDTQSLIIDNTVAGLLDSHLSRSAFFYGIYDCCHSGDIQKNVLLEFQLNKVQHADALNMEVEKSVRIDDLIFNGIAGSGYRSGPMFKDLILDNGRDNAAHFAASEPDVTALVVNIDGVRRSVFTWALESVAEPGMSIAAFESAVTAAQAVKTQHHKPFVTCAQGQRDRAIFT